VFTNEGGENYDKRKGKSNTLLQRQENQNNNTGITILNNSNIIAVVCKIKCGN
jgi:hypothetical protein